LSHGIIAFNNSYKLLHLVIHQRRNN